MIYLSHCTMQFISSIYTCSVSITLGNLQCMSHFSIIIEFIRLYTFVTPRVDKEKSVELVVIALCLYCVITVM